MLFLSQTAIMSELGLRRRSTGQYFVNAWPRSTYLIRWFVCARAKMFLNVVLLPICTVLVLSCRDCGQCDSQQSF